MRIDFRGVSSGPQALRRRVVSALALLLTALGSVALHAHTAVADQQKPPRQPNILWIVWDTVRADHLSVYGYEKATTPFVKSWARQARVYDDCVSAAGSTVPSHASMFTGLLPSEHGTHAEHRYLDDRHDTIAEIARDAGYQTYLYAANPHIDAPENFQQGFDVAEHPWSPQYIERAVEIVQGKISPQDRSSELPAAVRSGRMNTWGIKASGAIAQTATLDWLGKRDRERPYFVFLNYMEAHRPFIPAKSFRERMMRPELVSRSYRIDRSWTPMWLYTVGLGEYTDAELKIMAATYDATLLELDELFRDLIWALEASGDLEDTIIILTADHGEHLGEHHMLDHQFAIYEPLIRVPLIIRYPERFEPGRDARPVMTFDLFPTLVELIGGRSPAEQGTMATSLLSPKAQRLRLAEYPAIYDHPFATIKAVHPDWDPTPWSRRLRALFEAPYKYIWASDGRHELYDVANDPLETKNLIDQEGTGVQQRMQKTLDALVADMKVDRTRDEVPTLSEDQRKRLEALGYLSPTSPEEE